MQTLYHWLIGNMGTAGEYQYQSIHLYSTLAVALAVASVVILGIHIRGNVATRGKLLKAICIFQLGFEVLWRLIYLLVKGDSILCWWPIYPCNLGGILIPIFALTNCQTGKKMFYLFGFVGGVLTFALPEGIFSSNVLVFPILKSILQHTGLLMIPVLEYIYGTYHPAPKHMGWVIGGLLIHTINCEGISRLLGFTGDYMFLRSDMPFVIPGVPQFITLSVFALLVLVLLSLLCDLPYRKKNAVTS